MSKNNIINYNLKVIISNYFKMLKLLKIKLITNKYGRVQYFIHLLGNKRLKLYRNGRILRVRDLQRTRRMVSNLNIFLRSVLFQMNLNPNILEMRQLKKKHQALFLVTWRQLINAQTFMELMNRFRLKKSILYKNSVFRFPKYYRVLLIYSRQRKLYSRKWFKRKEWLWLDFRNLFKWRYSKMKSKNFFNQNTRILKYYLLRYRPNPLVNAEVGFSGKVNIIWKLTSNYYSNARKSLYFFRSKAEKFLYKRFPLAVQKYRILFYCPHYISSRRLHTNQIKEQQRFRWIYKLSYTQLVKMFKKIVNYSKNKFEYLFFKHLELRADVVAYRLNMAFSVRQARQWVKRNFFIVNDKIINWHKYQINVGDIFLPISELRTRQWPLQNITYDLGYNYTSLRLFWRPIQKDQYNEHFLINERIPAALIVLNPNAHKHYGIRPWSIQFVTLSLLKYS